MSGFLVAVQYYVHETNEMELTLHTKNNFVDATMLFMLLHVLRYVWYVWGKQTTALN